MEYYDDIIMSTDEMDEHEQNKSLPLLNLYKKYSFLKSLEIDDLRINNSEALTSTGLFVYSQNILNRIIGNNGTSIVPSSIIMSSLNFDKTLNAILKLMPNADIRVGYTSFDTSDKENLQDFSYPVSIIIAVKNNDPGNAEDSFVLLMEQYVFNQDDLTHNYNDTVIFHSQSNKSIVDIHKYFVENCLSSGSRSPNIKMLSVKNNSLSLSTIKTKTFKSFSQKEIELNYGKKFISFDEKLKEKLINTDKGIVMFHGPPGTGKTSYLRHLIPSLCKSGINVILMPKNILSEIESPQFGEFMIKNFTDKNSLFIIEDAESIVAKREESDIRSHLISTLLNVSDGILNDIFKIKVILTFNTELKHIDNALLRKGRLLAKHEFKALSKSDAIELCKELQVDLPKEDYTLANIYSALNKEDDDILLSEVAKDKTHEIKGF